MDRTSLVYYRRCYLCGDARNFIGVARIMHRGNDPVDPEQYWMVSYVKRIDYEYFDTEEEAVAFAKTKLRSSVEPPEKVPGLQSK